MARVPAPFRAIRAAVALLTRVPVRGLPFGRDEWRWASAWLPLTGALIGAALAGVWLALSAAGPTATAAVVLAIGAWLTGALHEDGLADTADALGGDADRERVLGILKDSRVGAYGALALALSVAVRMAALATLAGGAPVGLILAHAIARCPPVWLMAALPYVTDPATAKHRHVAGAGWPQVLVATTTGAIGLTAAVACGAVSVTSALLVAAGAIAVGVLSGRRFSARVGGITGDFLGATEQVGEAAVLLALLLGRGA